MVDNPSSGDIILENASVRIHLAGAGCRLSSIQPLDDPSSFNCSGPELYSLELTSRTGEKKWIGSNAATRYDTRRAGEDGDQRLELSFTHLVGPGSNEVLQVRCAVSLRAGGSESEWRIAIENKSDYAIQRVKYPQVVLEKRQVDPGNLPFRYLYDWNADYSSALLYGLYDGTLIPEPFESIPDQFGWMEEHPGRISTQLIAYYDRGGGLCLYTRDSLGSPKLMGFERRGTQLEISPVHLFPREFGADAVLGYAVSLAPFSGDWQAAADVYKRWAAAQPWTAVPVAERKDVPDWVKAGYPFLLYVQRRPSGPDGGKDWEASRPERALQVLKAYETYLQSPLVAVIFGWEKLCSWITPDVFPPFPGQFEFKQLVSGLKESGSRAFLYTSGTRWAVKNPRDPQWDGQADWEREGQAASCIGEDGQWAYDSRPWAVNHKLCIAAEGTRRVMDRYVAGFASLGIDATQYDQNLGGETYVCFSPAHSHPAGYGSWMYVQARQVLQRFLEESRKSNPDFAMSVEEPNEVLIPDLTFYDSRAMVFHGWPLLTNMPCLGVPLFSYLYHEFAIGFSGDYLIFLDGEAAGVVKIGRIVNAGHLLCDYMEPDLASGDLSVTQATPRLKLYKNASQAIHTYAHPFQVLGKMLATPCITVSEAFELKKATAQSYYGDERVDYVRPEAAAVRVPVVLAAAWLSPAGQPGWVFVNMSQKRQRVSVQATDLDPAWNQAGAALVLENLEGVSPVSIPQDPSGKLFLDLPPLQVSVLKNPNEL